VNVSWDDDIPNIWKVIKLMFQTTNQFMMIADKTCPTCLGSMLACGVRSGGKRCSDCKRLKYMICQKLLTGPWTSIQLLRLPLNLHIAKKAEDWCQVTQTDAQEQAVNILRDGQGQL